MTALASPHRVALESPGSHRFLLPFSPRRLAVLRVPVLVVGGGAGGASAALAAHAQGREVLVLEKAPSAQSNTSWAQGGLAAAIGSVDSPERHAADTLRVGCGLSDPEAVRFVTDRGPEVVDWLESLGVVFDQKSVAEHREPSREGGHSVSRVLSAGGDTTGRAIQRSLDLNLSRPGLQVRQDLRAVDVLVAEGRCVGVVAIDAHGELLLVLAGATILATGAVGQIYRETTNPAVATGDGMAMAFRAGAMLQDMEFVQFHPTTLYIAGAARVLVTEALRGAGAVLVDRNGQRVMEGQHEDLDLAPRDVVSRAILARMVETGDTHVYLDASGVDKVKTRFPGIAGMCAAFGLDIEKAPIPVRPGAHYMVGGVTSDLDARTTVPGLYVCGEVAATGLHGANRLASNSLLEALIMGKVAGAIASEDCEIPAATTLDKLDDSPKAGSLDEDSGRDAPPLNLDDMLYSLKSLMWRQVGLVRHGAALEDAEDKIAFWERVLLSRRHVSQQFIDLGNLLLIGRLVCRAAFERQESRGTHYRGDFPESDDNWRRRVLIVREQSA